MDDLGVLYHPSTTETVGIPIARIEGLAVSAVDKISRNATLSPPLPTEVVLDLFGLSGAEKQIVKTRLQSYAAQENVNLSNIIILD